MAQSENSTTNSGWQSPPGGLSPIPKEELFRVLDEENIALEDLPNKAQHLAEKIRETYEKSSGTQLQPGDMDGLGLARELRRRYPALPVVLISGYSSALQAAQEFTVLHKPCTPEKLTATLADALAAPPRQVESSRPG